MKIYIDNTEIIEESLVVENVHSWDFPEYCDAHFSYGETITGRMLTDEELHKLTDNYPELLNELAHQQKI